MSRKADFENAGRTPEKNGLRDFKLRPRRALRSGFSSLAGQVALLREGSVP